MSHYPLLTPCEWLLVDMVLLEKRSQLEQQIKITENTSPREASQRLLHKVEALLAKTDPLNNEAKEAVV